MTKPILASSEWGSDGRAGYTSPTSPTLLKEPTYARSYRPWGDSRTRRVPAGPQRSWQQLGNGPALNPRFRHDESIEQSLRNRNKPQQDPRYRPLSAEEFSAMNGLQTPHQDPRFRPLSPPVLGKSPSTAREDTSRRGFGMPDPRDYSSLPYANQTGVGIPTVNPLPGILGSGLYGAGLFPAPATPVSPWSYPGPWPIPGFY